MRTSIQVSVLFALIGGFIGDGSSAKVPVAEKIGNQKNSHHDWYSDGVTMDVGASTTDGHLPSAALPPTKEGRNDGRPSFILGSIIERAAAAKADAEYWPSIVLGAPLARARNSRSTGRSFAPIRSMLVRAERVETVSHFRKRRDAVEDPSRGPVPPTNNKEPSSVFRRGKSKVPAENQSQKEQASSAKKFAARHDESLSVRKGESTATLTPQTDKENTSEVDARRQTLSPLPLNDVRTDDATIKDLFYIGNSDSSERNTSAPASNDSSGDTFAASRKNDMSFADLNLDAGEVDAIYAGGTVSNERNVWYGNEYVLNPLELAWDEHQAHAHAWGGRMVNIRSQEENDLVSSMRPNNDLWLGGHRGQINDWYWEPVESDVVEFSDWCQGEPNNRWGQQDCILMWNSCSGKWGDARCSLRMRPSIYKRPFKAKHTGMRDVFEYYASDHLGKWEENEILARRWGGHLTSIHSEEENNWISNEIRPQRYSQWTCIGLKEAGDSWTWSDGTTYSYKNFLDPNDIGGTQTGYAQLNKAGTTAFDVDGNKWIRKKGSDKCYGIFKRPSIAMDVEVEDTVRVRNILGQPSREGHGFCEFYGDYEPETLLTASNEATLEGTVIAAFHDFHVNQWPSTSVTTKLDFDFTLYKMGDFHGVEYYDKTIYVAGTDPSPQYEEKTGQGESRHYSIDVSPSNDTMISPDVVAVAFLDDEFEVPVVFLKARKVRVQLNGINYLHLAEVQVFDEKGVNQALGKEAEQSSTGWNSPASNAVDGDVDDYSHTGKEQGAWWEVDMGEIVKVAAVKVWNRWGCCTEKLSDSVVSLLDDQDAVVAERNIGNSYMKRTFVFSLIPENSLIHHYQLNGTLQDTTGQGSATFVGNEAYQEGAARLDGDSYLELPPFVYLTNWTISAWFKMAEINRHWSLLWYLGDANDITPSLSLYVKGNKGDIGCLYLGPDLSNYDDIFTSVIAEADVWYHVAVTFEKNDSLLAFVNGELKAESTVAKSDFGATNWLIGKAWSAGHYFKGLIKDIRIYSAALPSTYVADLYAMHREAERPKLELFQAGGYNAKASFSNLKISYECPEFAHLQTNVLGLHCECDPGFFSRNHGDARVKIVQTNDHCEPHIDMVLSSGATWMSAALTNSVNVTTIKDFEVKMQQRESTTRKFPVADIDGSVFDKSDFETDQGVKLTGLVPGRRYDIALLPRNEDGVSVPINGLKASAVTHCSCSDVELNNVDSTGRPQDLAIRQEQGYVMFDFMDHSQCEESFSFTREEGSWADVSNGDSMKKSAFTSSYFFHSYPPNAVNHIKPGRQAADNLRRSNLQVGRNYTYCVRASAREYMHHPTDPSAPSLASSAETCAVHIVRWEASISGRVTLTPSAGRLPVEDVDVTWELFGSSVASPGSGVKTGSTKTNAAGKFFIAFNEELIFDKDVNYPVLVRFAKSVVTVNSTVDHTFLCDDGATNCTEGGTLVHLQHLDFDEPLEVQDATSVPFRGKVVVGGTSSKEEDESCSDCCPIIGAEVCLMQKYASGQVDTELVCVETDSLGNYEAPAPIGVRVTLNVNYHEHVFDPTDLTRVDEYKKGVLVDANTKYSGQDFMDTNTTHLQVDVAGGVCNKRLGTSQLRIALSGGCAWYRDVIQEGVRGYHMVPAQVLEVSVFDVQDKSSHSLGIADRFGSPQTRVIDLREVDIATEAEEESENVTNGNETTVKPDNSDLSPDEQVAFQEQEAKDKEEEDAIRRVRFQYDGDLTIRVVLEPDHTENSMLFPGDAAGECSGIAGGTLIGVGSRSLHVLPTGMPFKLVALLQYRLAPLNLYCDIMGQYMTTTLKNFVGLDNSESDQAFKDKLQSQGIDVSLLTACTETGGCELVVQHDEDIKTGAKSRARVEQMLRTGRPNTDAPYLKFVELAAQGVSHTANFIVTGDYATEGGASFPLPTHYPLLVVRDPPGGNSYASYENAVSTSKVTMDNLEQYRGIDGSLKTGPYFAPKADACAGLGVSACWTVAKAVGDAGLSFEGGGEWLTDFHENTRTGKYTVKWSYKTSDDPLLAGWKSDMFLVPNIDIKFHEVTTVFWNVSSCSANDAVDFKFDLESPENRPALAFYSVQHVEIETIPELEALVAETESELAENPDDTVLQEQLNATTASLDSWHTFLEDYRATNELASNGALDRFNKAHHWFDWAHGRIPRPHCEKRKIVHANHRCSSTEDCVEYQCIPESYPEISRLFPIVACDFFDRLFSDDCFDVLKCEDTKWCRVEASKGDWEDIPEDHPYWEQWEFHNNPKPDSQYSGLGPERLVAGSTPLDSMAEYLSEASSNLDVMNRIQFNGGGGMLEFSMSDRAVSEKKQEWNGALSSANDNYKDSFKGGAYADFMFTVGGVGVKVDALLTGTVETVRNLYYQDIYEDDLSIMFALGDDNVGDEFVVDVFFDPIYGTFVFHTVSGRSKCPHEQGTQRVEDPRITYVSDPSSRPVLPSDPIVFHIRLKNSGVGTSAFELFHDMRDNVGNLGVVVDGDLLIAPFRHETVEAGQEFETSVAIYKGPELSSYPPITIFWRSQCEFDKELSTNLLSDAAVVSAVLSNNGKSGEEARLVFAQPCPTVEWGGSLHRNRGFIFNRDSGDSLEVVVFNPNGQNLHDMVHSDDSSNPPLSVKMEYRELGEVAWRDSFAYMFKNDNLKEIDFARLSENYGFVTANWAIYEQGIQDGSYEIRVVTECSGFEGAPSDFVSSVTDILLGIIDRVPPKVYGRPYPQQDLHPGEELVISFSEKIRCERPYQFSLDVTVGNSTFGHDRLHIMCRENKVGLQFWEEDYGSLLGEQYTLVIDGVQDVAGNELEQPYEFESNFIDAAAEQVTAEFDVKIEQQCTHPLDTSSSTSLKNELASYLELDPSRIEIATAKCIRGRSVVAAVQFKPDMADSDGRHLEAGKQRSALDSYFYLARTLPDSRIGGFGAKMTLKNLVLFEESSKSASRSQGDSRYRELTPIPTRADIATVREPIGSDLAAQLSRVQAVMDTVGQRQLESIEQQRKESEQQRKESEQQQKETEQQRKETEQIRQELNDKFERLMRNVVYVAMFVVMGFFVVIMGILALAARS